MGQAPSANYYCTWHVMGGAPEKLGIPGLQPRDVLCDELLFGEGGLAVSVYPKLRRELYFLMDDGWELRSSQNGRLSEDEWFRPWLGSCQMSAESGKFPGYGDHPRERLKTLREKLVALGWKGLGLWISPHIAHAPGVLGREDGFEAYWRARLEWSEYAGVAYWKIDWGDYDFSDKHRKLLMKLKQELYPALIVENAYVRPPVNRKGREGRFSLAAHRYRLSYSDVLRTYDVHLPLSVPTTLSRVAALLACPPGLRPGCLGLINAEDEPYINAALGLSMGVMRFPAEQFCPPGRPEDPKTIFGGVRPVNLQLDEVARCVRWQEEYAPAFSIAHGNTTVSKQSNTDEWHFEKGQTWVKSLENKLVRQSAPRVIARNVNAPVVFYEEAPYILSCRNPNGALSLCVMGRMDKKNGYHIPAASINWDVGKLTGVIALFGQFDHRIMLMFDQAIADKRVYAKDILEDEFTDITDALECSNDVIIIPGALINEIGLRAATPGDLSAPGVVLRVGGPEDFVRAPAEACKPKKPPFYHCCLALLRAAAAVHVANNKRKHKKRLREGGQA
ncbi:MAG: hypothetical protein FWH26_08365 [Oscillospiraceae bacterium]|nr:hypothetical protein [Oscillospiraceae bacterium]